MIKTVLYLYVGIVKLNKVSFSVIPLRYIRNNMGPLSLFALSEEVGSPFRNFEWHSVEFGGNCF